MLRQILAGAFPTIRHVRIDSQYADNTSQLLTTARVGLGLVYLPGDLMLNDMSEDTLLQVLDEWVPAFPRVPPLLSKSTSGLERFPW